jgi:predicted TIM-barrel fold metal-dependent hydrolase
LVALKAQGVVGIAFNTSVKGVPYYRGSAALLAHLADLEMFLQLQFEKDELLSLLPLIEPFRGRLLIDHCGRPSVARGVQDPAFQAVLALGRSGRAYVKISGYNKFSTEPYPHRDTWPFVTALVEAFTPDRCMWGSDWPYLRTTGRVDVGSMLALAERLFPEPADRAKLLYDTPQRLFGYSCAFQATGTSR